jgi:hypothetical protein
VKINSLGPKEDIPAIKREILGVVDGRSGNDYFC